MYGTWVGSSDSMEDRVKLGNLEFIGNLERPCEGSVKGTLQVNFPSVMSP